MVRVDFKAYNKYVTDSIYQWDINRKLKVSGLNIAVAPEVHFSNCNIDRAIVRQASLSNGIITVSIPNSLLQDPFTINAHIGIYDGSEFKTVENVEIPVIPRERPADYQIETTDEEIFSFKALENALGNKASNSRVNNIIAHNNDTEGNSELIDGRTDKNGVVYPCVGDAVRYGSNRSQPTICFPGGHFNYDTSTYMLTYEIDEASYQIASVFNGKSTDNKTFAPSETSFNIAANIGALWYLIINVNTGTLRAVSYKDYIPTEHDYILLAYIRYKIYPMALSPLDLYENGKPIYKNNRQKGYLQTIGANVTVDLVNSTITIPATNYYMTNATGFEIAAALPTDQTVSVSLSSSVLRFVNYNVTTQTLSVVERQYHFKPDDYCLFGVCSGEVIPIEINPACVSFVSGIDITDFITVNDMLAPMFNADKTFKIVLGGDSITHGVGGTGFAQDGDVIIETTSRTWNYNTNGYCWAKLFKEYIESNYNATVVNNGCTGSNSDTWNNNKSSLIPADTDLFILTIGANDRNARTGITTKSEALKNYYNNITQIVKYCHDSGINIILASPIPASAENESENRLCHIYELNGVLQKVASENNIEYINMYNEIYYYMVDNGLNLNDYLEDGLHPNDNGYKLMYYRYLKLMNLAPNYIEVS